jgi:hypothetical protein
VFVPVLLASLLGLSPPELEPEREVVSLRWHSPIGCPTREQAIEQLRELLPMLPETLPDADDSGVEVAIAGQIDQEYVAELRFVSGRGIDARSIVGPSCEVVARAAVLVIAVTIDPISTVERFDALAQPVLEPAPVAEPAPVLEPEPVHELEPDPEPVLIGTKGYRRRYDHVTEVESSRVAHVSLGILGGGGWGPIQAGTGSLALELGVSGHLWRWGLRGVAVLPRTLDTEAGRRARYEAWLVHTRGCVVPTVAKTRIELPVCVGIEAGVLRGGGIGSTPNPRDAGQPWAAIAIGPGLRWVPHHRVALGIEIDLLAALLRGGFTIGDEVAQRHAPVGIRALVGVELRL